MTAKELRKLIGKDIKFMANGWRRIGEVLEVSGRNARIGGVDGWDWYWIPDMRGIEELSSAKGGDEQRCACGLTDRLCAASSWLPDSGGTKGGDVGADQKEGA